MSSFAEGGHPDSNGQRGGRAATTAAAHERRALRRALAAGAGAAVVVGGLFALGFAPAGGGAVAAGMLLGLSAGAIVAALWTALGIGIDILAGRDPARRRIVWLAGLVVAAFLATGFALAAGTAL